MKGESTQFNNDLTKTQKHFPETHQVGAADLQKPHSIVIYFCQQN